MLTKMISFTLTELEQHFSDCMCAAAAVYHSDACIRQLLDREKSLLSHVDAPADVLNLIDRCHQEIHQRAETLSTELLQRMEEFLALVKTRTGENDVINQWHRAAVIKAIAHSDKYHDDTNDTEY